MMYTHIVLHYGIATDVRVSKIEIVVLIEQGKQEMRYLTFTRCITCTLWELYTRMYTFKIDLRVSTPTT